MNIPMIRKSFPRLIASEICSVQPMNGDIFKDLLSVCSGEQRDPRQGELIHDFIRGWMRYYGSEYIPEYLWLKIKICGF